MVASGTLAVGGLMTGAGFCMQDILISKYGVPADQGWGPRQRTRFSYATPDDWYEALLSSLVTPGTRWLDVGCGRFLFPSNPAMARKLADRCDCLVGIDADANVLDNDFVHERQMTTIEDYSTNQRFDLITLRMVAEHLENPQHVMQKLAGLLRAGGRIIIYTVCKWSPSSVVAALTPMWFHHAVKHVLWSVEERDTFPTVYRMNTRREMTPLFEQLGLKEDLFTFLNDCRTTSRFRFLNFLELTAEWVLRTLGRRYPEACILAVYRKLGI